jgi:membrane-associated phospholipid phosphatase
MRLRALVVGIAAVVRCVGTAAADEIPLGPRVFALDLFAQTTSSNGSTASSRHSTMLREVAISGAAIGAGFLLDDTFEPGSGEGTFVDNAGNAIGSVYVLGGGTAVIALDGWVGHDEEKLGLAKDLGLALGATSGTVALLKATVSRERPDGLNDRSFPSGHSANSFAVATVLDRRYGGVVRWIAYGAAAFVAASRVIGNHHWFSDVVAAAVIGRFYGRLVTMEP